MRIRYLEDEKFEVVEIDCRSSKKSFWSELSVRREKPRIVHGSRVYIESSLNQKVGVKESINQAEALTFASFLASQAESRNSLRDAYNEVRELGSTNMAQLAQMIVGASTGALAGAASPGPMGA
ncbi:hypothetical protein [Agaribacterium haliotis]|uniref:hypothetical protein n=1 Tax=Agaribacterium haliotis TaxID=2013869 RepID=UPI001177A806|nr:hypothetical protein [Agaribacterium haliotis]